MAFDRFSSTAYHLPRKDIDTDLIIPARYLTVTTKEGLREGCFAELKKDPEFAFNDVTLQDSRILIAGPNFGCGSSREHAAWALKQSGVDVVIASDFADIFYGNAQKNGILPIILPQQCIYALLQQDTYATITVDLPAQKVIDAEGNEYAFEITEFAKRRLIEELSDLDYLAGFHDQIREFENKRREWIPNV